VHKTNEQHRENKTSMNTDKKTRSLVGNGGPSDPAGSPCEPTLDEIRARAYDAYIQRGRIDGLDLEDWLQAEKELKENRNKEPGVKA
jgi:hypothetical protein